MKKLRDKKLTRRTTNISQPELNNLKVKYLKKAKNYNERRFIESKQFDKVIKRQIKQNRMVANEEKVNKISHIIGETKEQQKVVRELFGETRRNGRKKNSFTSTKTTAKLNKILRQLKNKKFSLRRRIGNLKKFKEVRKNLDLNKISKTELLHSLIRTNFYYENKSLIKQHNKNVRKHGVLAASGMKTGVKLGDRYYDDLSREDEDLISTILE